MIPSQRHLSILLWNANGVRNHTNELTILLQDRQIDIALLTETRLTKRRNLYIPGYSTYRTDHPDSRAHGGAAIIIRKSISHHNLQLQSSEILQTAAVVVQTSPFPITLPAVYCPPNLPISTQQCLQYFSSLEQKS